MTSRDFIYWLQGFFEIAQPKTLTKEQVDMIQNHMAMVFITEIDPSFGEEKQEALSMAHVGGKPGRDYGGIRVKC